MLPRTIFALEAFDFLFSLRTIKRTIILFILPALTADTGKVSGMLLSPEMLFEKLIVHVNERDDITASRNIFGRKKQIQDCCKWKGVMCDADSKVSNIEWQQISGTIETSCLPDTVARFCIRKSRGLHGALKLGRLPHTLRHLILISTGISGTLDLANVHEGTETIELRHDEFYGTIALESLPRSLVTLCLDQNKLEGSLDLTSLPENFKYLYLSENNFSGSIDLTRLTPSLHNMDLSWNKLSGSLDVS